jgi:hypothetical protein
MYAVSLLATKTAIGSLYIDKIRFNDNIDLCQCKGAARPLRFPTWT